MKESEPNELESIDERIPKEYRQFWRPFRTEKVLYHLTPRKSLENMKLQGFLEPRDPTPKYWSGLKAIFMADPTDPLYEKSFKEGVLPHVREKHQDIVRLHLKIDNQLYRSIDPHRTFQVISLDSINIDNITQIEELENINEILKKKL